ncbi:protein adenylyltransferase SelO [Roseibium aggregatum]|uniref:protein adenylyltransferase SelO n=1 Tax=Roseibium aggregatum TaxID=187304 RepID=UPI001A8CDDC8|nr:YdiU family protein [Roseibium aggregatum]MBN8182709.1 YdiU family protein [Roseibium aggregatum]UES44520.1 YdiU family protein [Roseibium aggregatum]
MTARPPIFQFDNSYARDLPGFYVAWEGAQVPTPQIVVFNRELAKELGLDSNLLETSEGAEIFAGVRQPDGAFPLAQVYAGHQFGGFSPQLGDGRALLLGEIIDSTGNRKDIQLKGSGPTPFSRGGDGKAVVGPVLREYILGEAMHALGIPTTRALAAVTTGETIYRDGPKPGAVLTRVAASHLRVGTFQYFAARGETEKVRQLADYAIARHDPDLAGQPDRYIRLFRGVVERQAALVANWVLVGFVHGVMNTDNTTISGETIDYGPCAFIDAYDPAAVFSSIDHGGRYAFGRQPVIMQWNLARLAETLLPLIQPDDLDKAVELASAELGRFPDIYRAAWLNGMRAKLGLVKETAEDQELFETMLSVLQEQSVDYTLFFRHLSEAAIGEPQKLRALFVDPTQIDDWLERWRQRLESEGRAPAETRAAMNLVNPLYVPRNHKVEAALQSAETGEYLLLNELLDVLKAPYEERSGFESYALPAPEAFGPYQTFCGT